MVPRAAQPDANFSTSHPCVLDTINMATSVLRIKLQELAQASTPSVAGIAVLAAVTFHVAIQGVEFERYIFHFLASCVLSFAGLVYVFTHHGGYSLATGLARSSLVALSFHATLLVSIGFYRLALHRCRRFPGPLGAGLSRFYAAWLSTKKVQYNKELQAMHEKYGDFVRTGTSFVPSGLLCAGAEELTLCAGPREITILRKSAVNAIYGINTECRKSTWYGQTGHDPNKVSVNMTRDPVRHRLRRRAWDKGVAVKGWKSPGVYTRLKLADGFPSACHLRAAYQGEGRPSGLSVDEARRPGHQHDRLGHVFQLRSHRRGGARKGLRAAQGRQRTLGHKPDSCPYQDAGNSLACTLGAPHSR